MVHVEDWAKAYVLSTDLRIKMAPPPPPASWDTRPPERLPAPGRPPELQPSDARIPKSMHEARNRARALHAFWSHELQAAELMCWAILAFSDAELEFRQGLLRICLDEIRHMGLYRQHIEALGYRVGEFGIRDWFWSRVPTCANKTSFVAVMGMGLEAANLEHAPSFAARFAEAGDDAGARIQERVALDEMSHVKFGTHWFRTWTGSCDFDAWVQALPLPWSPWVLKGAPLRADLRLQAGMDPEFVRRLDTYVPEPKGRT